MSEHRPLPKSSDKVVAAAARPERSTEPDITYFPFPAADEYHVCIWGTPSSGKTTYLAMLYSALLNDPNYTWEMRGMAAQKNAEHQTDALEWLSHIWIQLRDQGRFPSATAPGKPRFMQFVFYNKAMRKDDFQFTFIEASGELYLDPRRFAQEYDYENPINYLQRCAGLVMLLDPVRAKQARFNQEFKAITDTLHWLSLDENGKPRNITVPIAFCLTKCDQEDFQFIYDSHDPCQATEEVAEEVFHNDLVNMIRSHIDQYRWFPLTALGFEKGKLPNIHYRYDGTLGIRDVTKLKPRFLGEPIQWVAERIPNLYRPHD